MCDLILSMGMLSLLTQDVSVVGLAAEVIKQVCGRTTRYGGRRCDLSMRSVKPCAVVCMPKETRWTGKGGRLCDHR